ncbi:MAG: sigma-70 family RNA polymerase sigma factor [Armatimonadetes bacterium]|nr:sigma-70 family RNA polymerase sigma factor [Armatimonadota bacterium]
MTTIDDTTLVERSLTGDTEAFAALVERYQSALFRLAYAMTGNREDAEDLCQECFLHIYRVLPKYNPDYRFSTWFKRVATNLFIDQLRKPRRRETCVDCIDDVLERAIESWEPAPDPEEAACRRDEAKRILSAVNRLPTELRIPFTLRYLDDLSFKEIAEILDLPIGTVSTRIRRGTEIIRRAIEAEDI